MLIKIKNEYISTETIVRVTVDRSELALYVLTSGISKINKEGSKQLKFKFETEKELESVIRQLDNNCKM